jgi:uncharacterized protein (DUF2384 family)
VEIVVTVCSGFPTIRLPIRFAESMIELLGKRGSSTKARKVLSRSWVLRTNTADYAALAPNDVTTVARSTAVWSVTRVSKNGCCASELG